MNEGWIHVRYRGIFLQMRIDERKTLGCLCGKQASIICHAPGDTFDQVWCEKCWLKHHHPHLVFLMPEEE